MESFPALPSFAGERSLDWPHHSWEKSSRFQIHTQFSRGQSTVLNRPNFSQIFFLARWNETAVVTVFILKPIHHPKATFGQKCVHFHFRHFIFSNPLTPQISALYLYSPNWPFVCNRKMQNFRKHVETPFRVKVGVGEQRTWVAVVNLGAKGSITLILLGSSFPRTFHPRYLQQSSSSNSSEVQENSFKTHLVVTSKLSQMKVHKNSVWNVKRGFHTEQNARIACRHQNTINKFA